MNVGGISRHLVVMATRMGRWNGIILAGEPDAREGSLAAEAAAAGARMVTVPGLKRSLNPLDDLRALVWLVRYLRRERPRVVMTHMAKAGALGRIAAALA